jgi:DNA (cytosine-5)-methyltransferase 1
MKAIDLFAGLGGFTAGAIDAGIEVAYAANHWPVAVDFHEQNHPGIEHVCQDLRQADWTALPSYDILLAGPACQGHSDAGRKHKNKRVRVKHDSDRSTAWAVVDCAEVTQPEIVIIENVPRMVLWGPNKKGAMFRHWLQAFELLGYSTEVLSLHAADYGVPQNRDRIFIVCRKGKAAKRAIKLPEKQKHRSIREILDPDAGGWASIDSKPEGVQRRWKLGRARYGRTFLAQHTTDHRGRDLDRPIATITTVGQHWHLVDGKKIRALTTRELARAQGFEDSTALPWQIKDATRLIGNAVPPPLAKVVIEAVAG